MANFCESCGTPLKEGAKFCTGCGRALTLNSAEAPKEAEKTTPAVEETVPKAAQSQKSVPTELNKAEDSPALTAEKPEAKAPTNSLAFSSVGETVLGMSADFGNADAGVFPGTAKLLATSAKSFFVSLKSALKNPKTLIIPLVLAGLWLILDILQVLNVNIFPVRVLSFLTFAKGGLYGGFFGFIGGIVGKGVFAGAVTIIAASLMRKGGGQKLSLQDTITKVFGFSFDSLGEYLAGIGTAMLIYLFICGGMVRVGLPVGLAAAYLTAKATLKRGFLQKLIGSLTARIKTGFGSGAIEIVKGMTVGFAAAALIGQLRIKLIIILLGILLTVGGIVRTILQKKRCNQERK